MTDYDDTEIDDEAAAEEAKKKKGKKEGEAQGVTAVSVSEGFYGYMSSIGASPSTIASILKSWSHLRGQGLLRAISDFIRGASTRATAHVQVDISEKRGFTLVHDVVNLFRAGNRAPTQNHRMDSKINRFDPK